ncbi:MAG: hypothetical protein DLM64_00290 [Solirubrobacterales bacterium]|nr:MAG: hypothetical protein DLM64_00290 [Solirubrobacterales bacterium]
MTSGRSATLLDAFLAAWAEADESTRCEVGSRLRPYLADDPERLLDAGEMAELLQLHPDTLVKMARTGRIWAQRAGREWRFRADRSEIAPAAGEPLVSHAPMSPRRARTVRASVAAIRGRD